MAVARRLEQALELCPVLVVLKGQIVCLRSEVTRLTLVEKDRPFL